MVKVGHEMDLLGQDIVDFEERVNIDRLKRDRLARLQEQMAKYDLGGMLIFDPLNIRYATGIRNIAPVVSMRWFIGYALVPQEGEPLITAADDGDGRISVEKGQFWEHFPLGRNMEAAAQLWGQRIADEMNQLGIRGQRLGVDRLDYYSVEALRSQEIRIADAREPFERARSIKTQDEIALMRQSAAIADVAISRVRDALEPGVTENKLFSILAATNIEFGGEHMEARLLAAGGNTNPWLFRASSDRLVRPGDLVVYDTDMAGPMGYVADISRTYLCGDGRPNAEQMEAYKIAHSFIYESLHLFKPGMSFQEIAEKCPDLPEEYWDQRYPPIAHGIGMFDEWPHIHWRKPSQSFGGFGNDTDVLEENMVICLEGLASKRGGRESVKLEEELLITANGPEILSKAPFDERFV